MRRDWSMKKIYGISLGIVTFFGSVMGFSSDRFHFERAHLRDSGFFKKERKKESDEDHKEKSCHQQKEKESQKD